MQYDIILEIEISNRNELFTYEQQIVDEAIKNQEPICNANTNIIKNMSTERTFKTYEQYREVRIVYEIDTFYYHIAKHFDIHKDTLNKALSLQTTYLEFKEKYERENLTWEQKVKEYMNVAPKYIPHTKNTSGVMTYNYLQVLCFYKLMYRIDEFSQILNFNTTGLHRVLLDNNSITINAKQIFDTWSIVQMYKFISPLVKTQLTRAKGKPVPFSLYFYIVYKRELGSSIVSLMSETGLDRTVISKYCNGKGNKEHINLYNQLNNQEKEELFEFLEVNPLLLPLNAE